MISLSVVVPVFNEEGSIVQLHREIREVCEKGMNGEPFDYEIIFVDDGSADKTPEICKELYPLKYIRFRKNFGQTAALDCGFKAAKGEYVVAMDADGQNDPADIPRLLEYLISRKLDVVSGWRVNRMDSGGKRFVSRTANFLRFLLIHDGIHDSGCTLKAYRQECLEGLDLYSEQHRFIPAILKIRGYTIGELPVNHRPRNTGRSKYNISRAWKGFFDMLAVWFWRKYSGRPLHMFGMTSAVSLFISAVFAVRGIILAAGPGNPFRAFVFAMLFLMLSAILMVGGVLSEILMRITLGEHIVHTYSIAFITENKR